jgi:hypothetical protein
MSLVALHGIKQNVSGVQSLFDVHGGADASAAMTATSSDEPSLVDASIASCVVPHAQAKCPATSQTRIPFSTTNAG